MRAFSGKYRCVAADNRGFGQSDKPQSVDAYTMDKIVEDIVAIIRYCQCETVTLVAHDWGGIAAWHFAARHPELLSRLIILNAPHPTLFQRTLFQHREQRIASQYFNRLRDPGAEARITATGLEVFWGSLFGAHLQRGTISAEEKAMYLETWSQPGALTSMLNWYRAAKTVVPEIDAPVIEDSDLDVSQIGIIKTPTLVIWGMQDNLLLPCQLDGLDTLVPFVEIRKVEDAGHGLLHEQPQKIVALMQTWLGGTSRS